MNQPFNIPVSILDLATVTEGSGIPEAFRRSLAFAQHAEKLGYHRYWFAEHHNMESIASAATSVLIGYIAGGTKSIRVGSGGIMLPNHAPLIIAEQFGTLESLYPGRIDLGLGRAPGTDSITSMALRRTANQAVDSFPEDVLALRKYFAPHDPEARVRAIPGEGLEVPIWLLGSSTYSAQLAAALGTPFAFASHFAPTYLFEALRIYKERFQPSEQLSAPYCMACVNMILADTDDEAGRLATSFYRLALGLVRNTRKPLAAPLASMDGLWTEYEEAAVKQMTQYTFIGSKETVSRSLREFIERTGINELMVASHIFSFEARLRNYELIAELFAK